jgi:hypothetical protein
MARSCSADRQRPEATPSAGGTHASRTRSAGAASAFIRAGSANGRGTGGGRVTCSGDHGTRFTGASDRHPRLTGSGYPPMVAMGYHQRHSSPDRIGRSPRTEYRASIEYRARSNDRRTGWSRVRALSRCRGDDGQQWLVGRRPRGDRRCNCISWSGGSRRRGAYRELVQTGPLGARDFDADWTYAQVLSCTQVY